MKLFEPAEQVEAREEQLRQQVNALPDEQRKMFYQEQAKQLKDPDTYASLNYLFLGGIHHFYLGKYKLFALELSLLFIAIIGFIMGNNTLGISILVLLTLFELPQLFFSQKIVRQYNNHVSRQIYEQVSNHPFA
jgi:hypothetical protein